MSRSCARPTCARPAVATLSYSYSERVAELEPLTGAAHPMLHDLCRVHATNVSVPKGWTLSDRFCETVAGVDPAGRTTVQLELVGA